MKGDHSLSWQTGSLPKARREFLRCQVQIDVGADLAWLADKTRDGLQEMVSDMRARRRMGLPHKNFSLTITPQVGSKSCVRYREVRENQLKAAQEGCQPRRYGWPLTEKAVQVPALQINDTIDIAGMLGQDGPTWITQKLDSRVRKGAA
jgi:hypothetical protein